MAIPRTRLPAKNNSLTKAASILKKEGIGAFPTETVYGLGADAFNVKAVAKIFEAKKRPVFDPLIVHVARAKQLDGLCESIPPQAKKLIKKFWPGPLTLVLPKKDAVPDLVTAGLSTVAVRCPKHPIAQKLLRTFGKPIAAPSANKFGFTSATDADSVKKELGKKIHFVLDGGRTPVGVESTIVAFTKKGCKILRPGAVTLEDIKKVIPHVSVERKPIGKVQAPGQLDQHYATRRPLALLNESGSTLTRAIKKLEHVRPKLRIGLLSFNTKPASRLFKATRTLSRKSDLKEAAHELFSSMRALDNERLDVILAETVPAKGIGLAIMDRLKRASIGQISLEKALKTSRKPR